MQHTRKRIQRSGFGSALQRFLLPASLLLLGACSSPLSTPTGPADPDIAGFSASDAVIESSAVTFVEDDGSATGMILVTVPGSAAQSGQPEDARVTFSISDAGERALWARMRADSYDGDAIYLGFDGVTERVYPDVLGKYVWVPVTIVDLDAGRHRISIGRAEPNVRLDMVAVAHRTDLTQDDLETWLGDGALPSTPRPRDPIDRSEGEFDLRGDPSFQVSTLPSSAQIWYRRLWAAIEDPGADTDPDAWAASDDLYTYARQLHTHIQTLLIAFRVTGDLKLLDEVDRLVEIMRTRLADPWRSTLDGTDGTKDGYRNWVWRGADNIDHSGKDVNKLDEMKTHAMLAAVAYALDLNRDLTSPSGRSYGAHADFWRDYLVNDFEAKWRERENEPDDLPFMLRNGTHTYYSWMKWHYYMGKLTGDGAYLAAADEMADLIWDKEIRNVDTRSGPGYVWARDIVSMSTVEPYLHPTTYARYVYGDFVEFYLEGFHRWAEPGVLERFARTFREYVIDPEHATDGTDWFASDIGGGVARAGIRSDESWTRMTIYRYEVSPYALIMAWDDSEEIAGITRKVLDRLGGAETPRTIYLASGFLLDEVLHPSQTMATSTP